MRRATRGYGLFHTDCLVNSLYVFFQANCERDEAAIGQRCPDRRQLSIRSKIILVLLLTGLACLAAGALIGYVAGEAALTQSVDGRLTALRELKRRRVEAYVRNELRFTTAVATSAETIEAAKAFIAAFREMRAEVQSDPAAMQADNAALEAWYNNDLIPRLDKIAGSHTPVEGLMPADPVARRLQADYIARNPHPVGEKNKLLAAPGGSRYDAAHARYHPMLRSCDAYLGLGTHCDAGLAADGRSVGEIRVPAFRASLGRNRRAVDRAWSYRL